MQRLAEENKNIVKNQNLERVELEELKSNITTPKSIPAYVPTILPDTSRANNLPTPQNVVQLPVAPPAPIPVIPAPVLPANNVPVHVPVPVTNLQIF